MRNPGFFDEPVQDRARFLGWVNGCPVVEELTDPENPNPGRGPEAMETRYAEVNFWYGYILREARDKNPALGHYLGSWMHRLVPAGKFEDESVPEHYQTDPMSRMNTLPGFALPRIFIEQLGTNEEGITKEEVQARLRVGQNILDKVIPLAHSPNQLLAMVAEDITRGFGSADSIKVLKHILGKGWLEEHEDHKRLDDFKKVMAKHAKDLWSEYSALSDEEKTDLGLA